MKIKKRLDTRLAQLYPQYSKTQLQSWIIQGNVQINGKTIHKPGSPVYDTDSITMIIDEPKFVCRAGYKLEKALDVFKIDVTDLTVLDAGLSTGGFTDCLLQRGAAKVYGVDVGYGQVHEKIRRDPRVIVRERTNLRHLTDIGEQVDLVTLDLSFISILKVMDAIDTLLKSDGILITLIKPQFEAEKHQVGKGGVIKDPIIHEQVVKNVITGVEKYDFVCNGLIESPILGATGNKEFLAYFKRVRA